MANTTRLLSVGEEFVPDTPVPEPAPQSAPAAPRRAESMVAQLLVMTLRTLPAKTIIALAGIADLAMIASVFVLWLMIIADPSALQLGGVAGYAVFVLIALTVRRRGTNAQV